ncbi:uncharacterized protein LOC133033846 [Cannabis sativa]|uniref:uncharacterized protein LOC133033846 n=1 Tax=Cannabis sativa TaxID=3483 RepID=UPI0029CA7540|nr:uncharacterized protein LOC133033846 [Cannabis sativa]
MLWKENEVATHAGFSNNHINVTVKMERSGVWLFTGLYREPNRNLRHKIWSLIRDLAAFVKGPWCVMGDVNNVCRVNDKKGGRPYHAALIQVSNDALWTDNWVEVRLYRALVNQEWLSCFSMAKLYNLEEKLLFCGENLAIWGYDILGNLKNQIVVCKKEIKKLKNKRDVVSCQLFKEANDQLIKFLGMKESYWRQRSKQLWLKEGDQNIKYFHASASAMRRNNYITNLCNNDGELVDWDSGLSEVMADYFHDLFSSSNVDLENVVDGVRCSDTTEQNNDLLLHVSVEEI